MKRETRGRVYSLALLIALIFVAPGCHDDDGGMTSSNLVFNPSTTTAAANRVRLTGAPIDDETVRLQVVLMGPTTVQTSDLYTFAFDIGLGSSAALDYVAGSAVLGDVLVPAVGQGTAILVSQANNRIVVGVSKTGGGLGNGIGAGDHTILTLDVHVIADGITTLVFNGSPTNPLNPTTQPAALDSSGAVVANVDFDNLAATVSR